MREIKFRAWDKKKKKWDEPVFEAYAGNLHELLITFSGELIKRTMEGTVHESVLPNRYILMQYTGLEDKNGKEIYEGDIVRYDEKAEGYTPKYTGKGYEVIWEEKKARFTLRCQEIWGMIYKGYEVIGNIYENPELLK
jgi:uncharacterized phage protein (TIGR01671 family)